MDKLTALNLRCYHASNDSDLLLRHLTSSESCESLEQLEVLIHIDDDVMQLITACLRFPNLKYLSCASVGKPKGIGEHMFREFRRLKKLCVLSLGLGDQTSFASDDLIDLVTNLPQLVQLSLCSHRWILGTYSSHNIQLKESTFLRICEIYQRRNQKLVIYNFDNKDDEQWKKTRSEPFAGAGQQEFVQYIAVEHLPLLEIVEV